MPLASVTNFGDFFGFSIFAKILNQFPHFFAIVFNDHIMKPFGHTVCSTKLSKSMSFLLVKSNKHKLLQSLLAMLCHTKGIKCAKELKRKIFVRRISLASNYVTLSWTLLQLIVARSSMSYLSMKLRFSIYLKSIGAYFGFNCCTRTFEN